MAQLLLQSRTLSAAFMIFFSIQAVLPPKVWAVASNSDVLRGNSEGRRLLTTADSMRAEVISLPTGFISRRQLATTCTRVSGYVSFADMDHVGDTISTSTRPASTCSGNTNCVAFNSAGQLKSSITPMTSSPGTCLYVKAAFAPTVCPAYPGFTSTSDVDTTGGNITQVVVGKAAARCLADTRCSGFNSAGILKSAVTPIVQARGVCLYTKNATPSRSPPPPVRSSPPPPPPVLSPSPPPPSQLPSPSPSNGSITTSGGCSDAAATLEQHNSYRSRHGSPALRWNEALANGCRSWAQNIVNGGCVNLRHSSGDGYGENLMTYFPMDGTTSSSMRCRDPVDGWYSEIRSYRWTSTPYSSNQAQFHAIGHFTQVVWKSSTAVGCGAAIGTDQGDICVVVCCRYQPPGNEFSNSAFAQNVPPLLLA